MLGELVAAQFEIEAAMKEMAGNASALSDGHAQLQLLSALQRQIGSASPAALAGMRSDIIATASTAQAVVHQSRATALDNDRMAELRDVTSATRQTIYNLADDLFEKKKLDPYLQFASAEDEAEYRKREAERQDYIKAELAKGTPEGALNASNAMVDQLQDAKKHGADRSPDLDDMLKTATATRDTQIAKMRPNVEQAASVSPTTEPQRAETNLDEIAAVLRLSGVLPPSAEPTAKSGHGLDAIAVDRGQGVTVRQT